MLRDTHWCGEVIQLDFASIRGRKNLGRAIRVALAAAAALSLSDAALSKDAQAPGQVDGARIRSEESSGDNWLSYGRTYDEQRFSPLAQIDARNVQQLGLAWSADISSPDGLSSTPLVVDGVIYLSGELGLVTALDAASGREIWSYRPTHLNLTRLFASWTARINRGVALWEGKVFVATGDCRLIALNAGTGHPLWDITQCDVNKSYGSTGAPRVVKGMVLIGNAGADEGARGYVSAYDANSGALKWRFYVVPGNPAQGFEQPALKRAAKTWKGNQWWKSGGGSAWDSISYDPDLNLIYFGTDGSEPWDAQGWSGRGDSLFTNSIVAVDADTGEYRWHYQETPADCWDYNSTPQIVLADLELQGRPRKVLLHAPKNGFFYVLDRSTGKLLSAEKYVPVSWASRINLQTGRPVETPNARFYKNAGGRAIVMPYIDGAHSWEAMSFSPQTGLVYIPAAEVAMEYSVGQGKGLGSTHYTWQLPPASSVQKWGNLIAWDPVAQRARWSVKLKYAINGGTLSTAGNLVFQGTAEAQITAYDARSGKLLWTAPTGSATQAAPISFRLHDEQYVLLPVGASGVVRTYSPQYGNPPGSRGPTRLLAFKLGGRATLNTQLIAPLEIPKPPRQFGTAEQIARGRTLYNESDCFLCHGLELEMAPGGTLRDLKALPSALHEQWNSIVLDGRFAALGMPSFKDSLSPADVEAIHAFVISMEIEAYQKQSTQTEPRKVTTP
jgi:quinohemoprotein ethanol dehydrogenase